EVLRDGKPRTVSAVIGERKQQIAGANGPKNERLAGVTFGDIPEDSPAYGRVPGVMVFEIDPKSRAYAAGLREGDIISSVNRTPVANLESFIALVSRIDGQLLLRVQRGNQAAFMVIK